MFKFFQRFFKSRAFYEGAKKTGANRDFWNANAPFETTARGEREVLCARARWLAANNAIMHNIDNSIISHVIGNGIKIQMQLGNQTQNAMVEEHFHAWAKSRNVDTAGQSNWYDMQRLIERTRTVDGEIFIYKYPNPNGLQLTLIETDALDVSAPGGGIERDEFGKPRMYHFKQLSSDGAYTQNRISIPAENIIHYYKKERPTQQRGISDYSQAILDIKNFSAFVSATVKGARARASVGYVVQTEAGQSAFGGTNPFGTNSETDSLVDYENAIGPITNIGDVDVFYLRPGENIIKTAPGSGDTEFNNFSETIIRMHATARSVSYELAFKDFSKVNYSSSRASMMQDYKLFDISQDNFTNYVYEDIMSLWMDIEVMSGRLKLPQLSYAKNPDKFKKWKYIFPKRTLVDPLKEALAFEKEIQLNMLTQSELAQRNGQDFEDVIAKKAQELEILKKYGLYVDGSDGGDAIDESVEREVLREAVGNSVNS